MRIRNPAPVTLKVFPKAACDSENCSESGYDMYTGENRPMTEKESRNRNYDVVFGTILRISTVKKQAETLRIIIFLFHKAEA
jgi:hypothetical protein